VLFDRHYAELCRLAVLLLDDESEAEAVVGEAFIRLFSGWRRFVYHDRAESHLRSTVVSLSRSRLRRRSAEHRGSRMVWRNNERRAAKREATDVAEGVDVLDAVQSLPERQREAVVFFYYLDLAIAEIADTLGSDVGTVRAQLIAARATLASLLAEADEHRIPRLPEDADTRGKRQTRAASNPREGKQPSTVLADGAESPAAATPLPETPLPAMPLIELPEDSGA
jgi:RNA polymerase sigma factor (sigma-70 family)